MQVLVGELCLSMSVHKNLTNALTSTVHFIVYGVAAFFVALLVQRVRILLPQRLLWIIAQRVFGKGSQKPQGCNRALPYSLCKLSVFILQQLSRGAFWEALCMQLAKDSGDCADPRDEGAIKPYMHAPGHRLAMLHIAHQVAGLRHAGIILQATKTAVGRLRPDFLDRCKPAALLGNAYLFHLEIGSYAHPGCTETDKALLDDGRSSFPSGAALSTLCTSPRPSLCDRLSCTAHTTTCEAGTSMRSMPTIVVC